MFRVGTNILATTTVRCPFDVKPLNIEDSAKKLAGYLNDPTQKSPHEFDTWEEGEYLDALTARCLNYILKNNQRTITVGLSNTTLLLLQGIKVHFRFYFNSTSLYRLIDGRIWKFGGYSSQDVSELDMFTWPYSPDISSVDLDNRTCTFKMIL